MNYKYLISTLLLSLITSVTHAQLYIEADPLAYGLNGHSLHIGVQGAGFRFQVGTFGAEYPDSFKENKEFDVNQRGYGVKLDYYGDKPEGAFVGIEYNSTQATYGLSGSQEKVKQDIRLLGIRTGYKFMFKNSLYIMPWIGFGKNISGNADVRINNQVYKSTDVVIFPTVHIGFEF